MLPYNSEDQRPLMSDCHPFHGFMHQEVEPSD
jgi:hypothetical protein